MKKLTKLLALTMTGGLLLAACGDAYNGDDNESPGVDIYDETDETDDMDETDE